MILNKEQLKALRAGLVENGEPVMVMMTWGLLADLLETAERAVGESLPTGSAEEAFLTELGKKGPEGGWGEFVQIPALLRKQAE